MKIVTEYAVSQAGRRHSQNAVVFAKLNLTIADTTIKTLFFNENIKL